MGKEIIQLVEVIANERVIDNNTVFDALELSLEEISKKALDCTTALVNVNIDKVTGEYETYRRFEVVADNYPVGIEQPVSTDDEAEVKPLEFDENCHIKLTDAQKNKADIAIGEFVENIIDNTGFGRISIQLAKNIISKKIYEAERLRVFKDFKDKQWQIITGTVKKFIKDAIILDLGNKAEAILPRDQLIGRENLNRDMRIKAVITDILEEVRGAQIKVSRTNPKFLYRLLELEIPEISDQIIKIQSIAREPGFRAKVAVTTNDSRIDAVGACVGMRGARIQAVIDELNGERIDVVLWNDDPAELVMNLLKPAEIDYVSVDEALHSMDVAVKEDSLAMAIGKNGQNVRLASQMTEWKVNILSIAEANAKQKESRKEWVDLFTEKLEVNEEVAEILVNEGFVSIDEISRVDSAELAKIEGFDEEIANSLIERAGFQLLMMISQGETILPQQDLLDLPSVSEQLAHKLSRIGISTRAELADQGAIDLVEDFKEKLYEELNGQLARDLVIEARGL